MAGLFRPPIARLVPRINVMSEPLTVICPHCRKQIDVPYGTGYAKALLVKCPGCRHEFDASHDAKRQEERTRNRARNTSAE